MKIDEHGRCWRSEQELIDLLNFGTIDIAKAIKQPDQINSYNLSIGKYYLDTPKAIEYYADVDLEEFHTVRQETWLMPQEYKDIDILEWVMSQCSTEEEMNRAGYELILFEERNLLDILRYLKYLVDVMRTNNIVWGVGRGSCTASYVLFKIGIHKIDSIKYDLDISEFLKF
jgi:DNA polymerase III alpha subunit